MKEDLEEMKLIFFIWLLTATITTCIHFTLYPKQTTANKINDATKQGTTDLTTTTTPTTITTIFGLLQAHPYLSVTTTLLTTTTLVIMLLNSHKVIQPPNSSMLYIALPLGSLAVSFTAAGYYRYRRAKEALQQKREKEEGEKEAAYPVAVASQAIA